MKLEVTSSTAITHILKLFASIALSVWLKIYITCTFTYTCRYAHMHIHACMHACTHTHFSLVFYRSMLCSLLFFTSAVIKQTDHC